jgi:putative oxidoreductase
MKHIIDLLGRIFISVIFIYEAYDTIFYIPQTRAEMTKSGITWQQDTLLYGGAFFLVVGGLMLLFGYRAKLASFLLLCYWIPITFLVYDWWNYSDAGEQRWRAIIFMKNISIMGGLLVMLVHSSGKYSVKRLFATTKVTDWNFWEDEK